MNLAKAQTRVVRPILININFQSLERAKLTHLDGIGLACGVLEHLLNLEDPPKVIAATHFHEIFENDFLPLRPGLQLGHMQVKLCEKSQQVEDQVTYLYKFVPMFSLSHPQANVNTTASVLAEAPRATVLCTSHSLSLPFHDSLADNCTAALQSTALMRLSLPVRTRLHY